MSWPSLPLGEGSIEERKVGRINPLPRYLLGMLIYAAVWTPVALVVSGILSALPGGTWDFIPTYMLFGGFALIAMPPTNIVCMTWIAVFGSLQFFLARSSFLKISWLDPEMPVRRSFIAGLVLGLLQAAVAVPVAFALGFDDMGPFGVAIHHHFPLSQVWMELFLDFGMAGFAGAVASGYMLGLFLRTITPAVIKAT